jgi:hypothetical protein
MSLASFGEAFVTEKPFQRSIFIGITCAMVGMSGSNFKLGDDHKKKNKNYKKRDATVIKTRPFHLTHV